LEQLRGEKIELTGNFGAINDDEIEPTANFGATKRKKPPTSGGFCYSLIYGVLKQVIAGRLIRLSW
jgi:hypothetical protein